MKPHNLANSFRQARMRRFVRLVEPLLPGPVRILDIGGTPDYWRALPPLYGMPNIEITIVNLWGDERDDSNLRIRQGDALSLDFHDQSFDLVHSNSVIEHVGRWPEMRRMAAEVRRVAPRYFVQTPNFWFPLEPHYRLPLMQFFPRNMRRSFTEAIGRGWPHVSIELLTAGQMATLFPDAAIERERYCGLTKSLLAIKSD